MALTNCDECSKELSEHAEACPHCGAPAKIALETYGQKQKFIFDKGYPPNEAELTSYNDAEKIMRAVRDWVAKDEDEEVDREALEGICELSIDDSNLTDISTLKNLPNLEVLSLSRNKLTDISPLANLTELKELELDDNQITDVICLADLPRLHSLRLSRNKLKSLEGLKNLPNLTVLQLRHNQLTDISALTNLESLEWLCLENNKLTDVDVLFKLENLTEVHVDGNPLTKSAQYSIWNGMREVLGHDFDTDGLIEHGIIYDDDYYEDGITDYVPPDEKD
jgi:Leucine-rich repeat (LRR) protein